MPPLDVIPAPSASRDEPATISRGAAMHVCYRLLRHRAGRIGLLLVGVLVATALFGPWLSPHDPSAIDYGAILAPPDVTYPFGTDDIGRDILSRVIQGARV